MRVLITGATGGLGSEIVERLLRDGNTVTGTYCATRDPRGLAAGAKWMQVDFSSHELPEECLGEVAEQDALVLCAGIAPASLIGSIDPESVRRTLSVNLVAPILMLNAALPRMVERGFGRVVLLGSIVARDGAVGLVPYASSKAALKGVTASGVRDLRVLKQRNNPNANVTVNLVSPGYTNTPMTSGLPEKVREKLISQSNSNDFVSPRSVVDVISLLLHEGSSDICGSEFEVNAGQRI